MPLDPNQVSQYSSAKRNINNDFAAKRSANTFSQTLSQRRGTRQQSDFTSGFKRQVPSFTAGFANRGLGGSGVYQRAMQQFTGDYARDLGRMQEDQFSEQAQFGMNDAALVNERDRVLGDLELDKANQIAMTAMGINGLRPYMA